MDGSQPDLPSLAEPSVPAEETALRRVYTPDEATGKLSVIKQVGEEALTYVVAGLDLYRAATQLAALYRLALLPIYRELKRLYGPDGTVPQTHIPELRAQIEAQLRAYEIREEEVEEALALVKPEGFDREQQDGQVVYTAQITYQKGKEHLLLSWRQLAGRDAAEFGFHYSPYNFDSNPEKDFFLQLLDAVNLAPDQVEDIYFTGALTDPRKTDFYVEYKGQDGAWHRYTPDFVIRRVDGRCYIVEIKMEKLRADPLDGAGGLKSMALRQWTDLNPEQLQYEIIDEEAVRSSYGRHCHARKGIHPKRGSQLVLLPGDAAAGAPAGAGRAGRARRISGPRHHDGRAHTAQLCPDEADIIRGYVLAHRTYILIMRGEYVLGLEAGQQALKLLPPDETAFRAWTTAFLCVEEKLFL